jgi:hypothetical protein
MKEQEKRKRKGQRNEKQQKGKKKYPEIVLESSNLTSIVPITVEKPTKNQIRVTKAGGKAEKKGNINTDEQIKVLTKEKIAETTETKKQGAKVEANVERKGPVAKNMEVGKKLDQLNSNALQLEKQMKEYVKSIQSSLTSIGKPTLDSFRSAGLEKGATGLKSKVIKHLLKKLGLPLPNKSQMKGQSLLFLVFYFYCCYSLLLFAKTTCDLHYLLVFCIYQMKPFLPMQKLKTLNLCCGKNSTRG